MAKKLMLTLATTVVTLAVALGLVRLFAPGLLGIAPDLQLVRVAEKAPPFFEVLFGKGESGTVEFLIRDPLVVNRGRPLYPDRLEYGLHDVLGFRNRAVPSTADVVAIGDSQTYGNNAPIDLNWPGYLYSMLSEHRATVYNMSVGGWEAPQYLYILDKALHFSPQVVVVAFYSGNDPVGSFVQAYGADHWKDLRPDPSLSQSDRPPSHWPPKPEESWRARFADGTGTVFTPLTRLSSNLPGHPAVRAGWSIMAETARRIAGKVGETGARTVFTVIPTKELVYAPRVEAEGLRPPEAYATLVASELDNIRALADSLSSLQHAAFVDTVTPLQRAARTRLLYPADDNGHPTPPGYEVIAEALAPAVASNLTPAPSGLLFFRAGQAVFPLLARGGELWLFDSMEAVAANGWTYTDGTWVEPRQVAGVPYAGTIDRAVPERFGPAVAGVDGR